MAEKPEICTLGECIAMLGIGETITNDQRTVLRLVKTFVENEARKYCGHDIMRPATPHVTYLPVSNMFRQSEEFVDVQDDKVILGHGYSGTDKLQLPHVYVLNDSTLDVREDFDGYAGQKSGAFATSTKLTKGTDYFLDVSGSGDYSRTGLLIRTAGAWSGKERSIKVTYNAGFTASDLDGEYADVRGAVIDEVVMRYQMRRTQQGQDGAHAFVKSERTGDHTITYDTSMIPKEGLLEETKSKLAAYVRWGLMS
jgi:hypothetical protein